MIINYDNIRRLINQYLENHLELKKLDDDYKKFEFEEQKLLKEENDLLKKNRVLMQEEIFKKKYIIFEKKIIDYEKNRKKFKDNIFMVKKKLINEGKEIIDNSIQKFMKENHIDLIFEPMFYSKNDENEELTEKLFEILKKKLKIKEEIK